MTIFSERTEKSVSENSAGVCSERTEDVPRLMDRLCQIVAMIPRDGVGMMDL